MAPAPTSVIAPIYVPVIASGSRTPETLSG